MATDHNFKVKKGIDVLGGDVNLGDGFSYKIDGTTVVDSSRNLANIGTVSSGSITSSGQIFTTLESSSSLKSRFLMGKASGSTANGELYLQYGSSDRVYIGAGSGGAGLTVAGSLSGSSGFMSGKFAVKSTSVHASYDLYNDGTSYFNGAVIVDDNLTVSGNLTVNGTTTTLNTATLDVEDKNITLNYSTGDSSGSADGAGITIQDAVNSTTDATILWDATNDEFDFSHPINVSGNSKIYGSGSSSNALNVYRGSDGASALRVLNTGEVLVSSNYFYVNASQGAYFTGAIRARGGISNDGGNNLSISSGGSDITFNSKNFTSVGTISSGAITTTGDISLNKADGFVYLNNVGTGNSGIYVRGITSSNTLRSHSTNNFRWEVTGSQKMELDSSGNLDIAGNLSLNNNSAKFAAPVYRGTASSVSNAGYTTLFTVTGSALASTIRMTLAGTANSVVVNLTADITVGHYQDILITSRSGFYTLVTLKVTSDNNEDFAVEATTNSANAVTLSVEVFPLNNETVTFTSSHSYTGQSHTHTCSYGVATSGAGGNSGDHRTRGRHFIQDGSIAAPGLVFENDSNTGFYRVGSDSLGIVAAASRKFYVNSSNAYFQNLSGGVHSKRVTLGTGSSDAGELFVNDTSTTSYTLGLLGTGTRGYTFRGSSSSGNYTLAFENAGTGAFNTTFKGDMTISPGNMTIEKTGADTTLEVIGDSNYDPVLTFSSNQNSIATEGFQIWYDNSVGDVHLHTTYAHDDAYIRFHTRTGASKSTSNERLTIAGHGTVGINKGSGLDSSYKLDMGGHIKMNNNHIHYANEVHFNGNTRFKSHNTSTTLHRSGHSTASYIALDTNGTIRGYLAGNSASGHSVGLLDQGGSWAVRHVNDQGTIFYSDGETEQGAIGKDLVAGDYGSMVVKDYKNSWAGYSINNHWVFMSSGAGNAGIYNDTNNEWAVLATQNADVKIYHNGNVKITTSSSGATVTGTVEANAYSVDNRKFIDMPSNSAERGAWNPIVSSIRGSGRVLYNDEDFSSGLNSVGVYNNSGGGTVTITREDATTSSGGSAPNSSGKVLKIYWNGGTASPNRGGFIQSIPSEDNHTFVQIFQAKAPSGSTLHINENAQGTNSTSYWLTNNTGTGEWEWYARISHCGDSGSFSSGGHISISGPSSAFSWYLASCTVIDVTETPLLWSAYNDGSGSGLDADTLDGLEGSFYFKSYTNNNGGWSQSNRNFSVRTGGNSVGLHMEESDGTFGFQLYGDGSNYGFLDGEWANWDLKKTTNGKLTFNGNDTYFLQPEHANSAKFRQYVQIGDSSSYGTNSGSWGARLNVTDDVHAKIVVAQDADSMESHWYAHTGHSSIKFGTNTSHDVEFQRNGSTHLEIESGGLMTMVPIRRNSHHASGFLEGSYNSVGSSNNAASNPIYTIGSSYNPNETTLNNMYGIGFTKNSTASFLTGDLDVGDNNGWGLYVAAAGAATIFLNGSDGIIQSTGQHYADGSLVWNAGNDGDGSTLDADLLDGYHLSGSSSIATKIFNNKGQNHSTVTNFNTAMTPGPNYVQSYTNGPENTGQWYGFMLGLGNEYGTTTGSSGHYASQMYFKRNASNNANYLYMRSMENGNWQNWLKVSAGYADTAGDADTVDGVHESTFMRKSANSGLDMNNNNITEINSLSIADPGPTEGLTWAGGNGWKIVECPNDMTTNNSGNLQLATSARRVTITTDGDIDFASGRLMRSDHHLGHLEGSYNNVAANSAKTNPIYTIGSNYNPSATSVSGMYGVGYAHPNLWGTGSGKNVGWGMYVVEAGTYNFIAGRNGTWSLNEYSRNGNKVWDAGNDGSGSGLDADTVDGHDSTAFEPHGTLSVSSDYQYANAGSSLSTNFSRSSATTDTDQHGRYYYSGTGQHRTKFIPIDKTASYRMKIRWKASAAAGTYIAVFLLDTSGNNITGSGTYWRYPWSGTNSPTSWTTNEYVYHANEMPSNAAYIAFGISHTNYNSGNSATYYVSELELEKNNQYQYSAAGGVSQYYTASRNLRGYIGATETNDAHFVIATSGGEDIAFKDGGMSGTTNMVIRGDGTLLQGTSNVIWHQGNDGPDSGLNADLLDGSHASAFMASSGMANNADTYMNFRVMRNNNSSSSNDGMYIGYGNTGSGHTRLFGGGATSGGLYIRGSGANDLTYGNNTGTIWHSANDGSGTGLDADLLDGQQLSALQQAYARVQGWNPAYSNSNDATIYYDFSERAVVLDGATDSNIGAAYKAIPVNAGEQIKFNIQIKANGSYSSGLYVRIYYYTGDLPNGKTHVSNSASHTLVQEDSGGDSSWYENGSIGTSYTSFNRTWTAPTTGFVSLVVLNWTGIGTGKVFVKDASYKKYGANTAGIASFTSGSNSTSTTNGAVRITGGLGVGYNVHAGGVVRCNSGFVVNTTTVINSSRVLQNLSSGSGSTGLRFTVSDWIQSTEGKGRFYLASGSHSYYKSGGTSAKHLFRNGLDSTKAEIDAGGNAIFSGNVTAYGSPSDIRLKENIEVIPDSIEKVKNLRGITFNYKKDGKRSTGLVAQELQKVLPEAVYETKDAPEDGEDILAIRYGNVVGLLVEALKEQQTQIDNLTTLVNKLKEK